MSIIIELLPEAGPALIAGGGRIALRKARNLAEGGFAFTVVAPTIDDAICRLPSATVIERAFEDADMDAQAWSLVFACTNAREVNRRVGELARERRIPVVVTDRQAESTFFTPATVRDGAVSVAVSTGGASPGMAKALRERVTAALGPRLGQDAMPTRKRAGKE